MLVSEATRVARAVPDPWGQALIRGRVKMARTDASVPPCLDQVADPKRRADALELRELMTEATGNAPAMWATRAASSTAPTVRASDPWQLFAARKQAGAPWALSSGSRSAPLAVALLERCLVDASGSQDGAVALDTD